MKRKQFCILLLVMSVVLSACGETKITTGGGKTKTESEETEEIEEEEEEPEEEEPEVTPTEAVTYEKETDEVVGNRYLVETANAYISVPDGYTVLYKGCKLSDEELDKLGVDRDRMELYVDVMTDDFKIVPEGYNPANAPIEYMVKVKPGKYAGVDFRFTSKSDIDIFAVGLVTGFKETEYELVNTDYTTFIKFNDVITAPELRYATVVNGNMIYIYASAKNGLDKYDEDILQAMVYSFNEDAAYGR